MRAINDFDNISVFESKKLIPGGYVCKLTKVEDFSDKEYLRVEFDIAQGEYKDTAIECMEQRGFWSLHFVKSYSDKSARFFKGFITAVTESNPGFKWDWDESKLVGKLIGIVLSPEEYLKRDGSVGQKLTATHFTSVKKIADGDFEVKPLKTLDKSPSAPLPDGFAPIDLDKTGSMDDLPFTFGDK